MAQCEECGARNAENATFCVRCGAELTHGDERIVGEDTDTLDPVQEDGTGEREAVSASSEATAVSEPDIEPDLVAEDVAADVAEDHGGEAGALLGEAGQLLSDGDADGAAVKCREAIEIAPDLVAAYSLLGMAEEQRGNTVAAAGAYRRVLQLDPERTVEREKLETLYAEGGVSPHGAADREGGRDRIVAWAPWVAAVAAAFFVMMTLTAVGLRVHAAGEAERLYTEQIAVAKASLDSGEYREAAKAFETALAVRPEDSDAKRGLNYARRKMNSRVSTSARSSAPQQQRNYQASIVPSGGPNPFPSIPIGPENDRRSEPEPEPGQPPQTRQAQPTRSTPPPVMSRDERVEVTRRSERTTSPGDEAMPFEQEDVLEAPPEEQRADDDEASADREETEPVEDEPQGEITIWRSPRGSSASDSERDESPSQDATTSEHADRARQLRRQAQAAIDGGNCDQGRQLLDQAIEQYQADTAANPSKRQANQAAIATCETLRQRCEVGEDQ
ncbi:MAG: tetratricopeptide repeat protein [Armatimonadota bacterium]